MRKRNYLAFQGGPPMVDCVGLAPMCAYGRDTEEVACLISMPPGRPRHWYRGRLSKRMTHTRTPTQQIESRQEHDMCSVLTDGRENRLTARLSWRLIQVEDGVYRMSNTVSKLATARENWNPILPWVFLFSAAGRRKEIEDKASMRNWKPDNW